MTELDDAAGLATSLESVELALWFHDAVYDTRALDNEEQSAVLARQCLTEAAVEVALVERIEGLVMATKSHAITRDPDTALMLDVDLSILGQSEKRFAEYEAAIRQEYYWVPENTFTTERAKILERFLARERLYITDQFFRKYEVQARLNLEQSLAVLKSRAQP